MPALNPPILGSSTQTQPLRTFDSVETSPGVPRNFGLAAYTAMTTPASINTFSTSFALGTANADLDGLLLGLVGLSRPAAINIFLDGVQKGFAIPFVAGGSNADMLPIGLRIPSGSVITGQIATNVASQGCTICPIGYQDSIASDITTIEALGSIAAMNNQGVNLPAGSPNTWVAFPALTKAAKTIEAVHRFIGGQVTRSAQTIPVFVDIGIGSGASPTILLPKIPAWQVTNNIEARSIGRQRFSTPLPIGTVLQARARLADGTQVDAYNVQLALGY